MTILMLLAAWFAVSVPVSLTVGCLFRAANRPRLLGMDGADAIYLDADGYHVRVPLLSGAPRS